MSNKRSIRFAGLMLAVVGGLGTAVQLSGLFDYGEGSLWLPVTAVIGVLVLMVNRPKRK